MVFQEAGNSGPILNLENYTSTFINRVILPNL